MKRSSHHRRLDRVEALLSERQNAAGPGRSDVFAQIAEAAAALAGTGPLPEWIGPQEWPSLVEGVEQLSLAQAEVECGATTEAETPR